MTEHNLTIHIAFDAESRERIQNMVVAAEVANKALEHLKELAATPLKLSV